MSESSSDARRRSPLSVVPAHLAGDRSLGTWSTRAIAVLVGLICFIALPTHLGLVTRLES